LNFRYAIRQAVDDENVKGIILRVNSGGGSAVASDQIAREIQRAKEKGKKVVASMVAVAASGGYFISMNADKVLVQKSTITGSIGVVFGKFVASELFERIGISWDDVKTGENGDLFSFNKKYSENTRKKAFNLGKEVYDDFVGKAAQARGMDVEKMEEVAQGRVWTGIDAKERNLVDEFGGLVRAIEFVKESSELKPAQKIELVRYPRPLSFFQSLFFQKKSSEDTNISQASVSMHPSPFAFALSMFGLSNSESRQISSTLESSLRHDQTLSLRLGLAESLALYSIIPCQH
jgi:protease-4